MVFKQRRSRGNNIVSGYDSKNKDIGKDGYYRGKTKKANYRPLRMIPIDPIIKELENEGISMLDLQHLSLMTNIPLPIIYLIISGKARAPDIIADLIAYSIVELDIVDHFDKQWILEDPHQLYRRRTAPNTRIYSYGELVRNSNYLLTLRFPISQVKVGDFIEIKDVGWVKISKVVHKEESKTILIYSGEVSVCEAYGNEEIICFRSRRKIKKEDEEDSRKEKQFLPFVLGKMSSRRESETIDLLLPEESKELRDIWDKIRREESKMI